MLLPLSLINLNLINCFFFSRHEGKYFCTVSQRLILLTLQVLKAVNIKMTVSWDVRSPDYTGHIPEHRSP